VASLNCRGLNTNFEDIKADMKLLKADVIMLQEISVDPSTQENFNIDGFQCQIFPNGKGKGIALFFRQDIQFNGDIYTASELQLATVDYKGAKLINVYRSSQGSLTELKKMIDNRVSSAHGVNWGFQSLCTNAEEKSSYITFGENWLPSESN